LSTERKTVKQMVADANTLVRVLSVEEAMELHGRDGIVFIDLRDIRELARTGRIAGARHVPRGMLEFWIDPDSPYHKEFLAEEKTFVFYCAGGWRSALSARLAQEMGMHDVAHIEGGMTEWLEKGGPVDPPKQGG
jgi:rhodanese-related sulfurtransferase